MTTQERYEEPAIERICLDNDIALQLQSDANPMDEPNWVENTLQPLHIFCC
jgi:hypothetical protein